MALPDRPGEADANPAALTSWGRRIEEVLGRTADEIFPDADVARTFLPLVEAVMASGQPRQWATPFAPTAQVLRMVSVPVGDCFVSTGVDVTAERARQLELEHALQQVTQATQAGSVGLWDWDLRKRAVRHSDEWKRQLGHAPAEVVDSFEAWRSRVHPDDLGSTLAAAQLAPLFERFNRLGAEGSDIEGSGIGLFITRELLRRMGGRIDVQSEPGQGTSFTLWLPAAAASPAGGAVPSPGLSREVEATEPSTGGARVEALYVEDNEVNVTLMQAMADRRPGIALRVARSGHEALSCLRERPARLVLMDMNLGDCHGLELIERLRGELDDPHRLHVAVSADASQASIDRALTAGFQRYFTKPVKIQVVLALFDELLQEAAGPRSR